jgi:hypothetical protein
MAMIRSEVAGWFASFGRYSSASRAHDTAFFLEAYDGGSMPLDRIKNRRRVNVPFVTMAIGGGIQPDVLAGVFNRPSDGMTARFLYVYPNLATPERSNGVHYSDAAAELTPVFRKLRSLDWDRDHRGRPIPRQITASSQALNIAYDQKDIAYAQNVQGIVGLMPEWLGKNSGRVLRVALVLELLRWAKQGGPEPTEISPEMAHRAKLYLEYCTDMLRRCQGETARSPAQRDASRLAQHILENKLDTVNARQLYQSPGWHALRRNDHRGAVFSELVSAGWLQLAVHGSIGRPAGSYEVNPKVHQRLR